MKNHSIIQRGDPCKIELLIGLKNEIEMLEA